MKFTALVPNIFYSGIRVDLKLIIDCLGFRIGYGDRASEEQPFCVAVKDKLKVHLVQSEEFAVKDRPEIRLETDNIEEVYKQVMKKHAELIHPNSKEVLLKPWNAKRICLTG